MSKLKTMYKSSRLFRFSLYLYIPFIVIGLVFLLRGIPSVIPLNELLLCYLVALIGGFGSVYLADSSCVLFPTKNNGNDNK